MRAHKPDEILPVLPVTESSLTCEQKLCCTSSKIFIATWTWHYNMLFPGTKWNDACKTFGFCFESRTKMLDRFLCERMFLLCYQQVSVSLIFQLFVLATSRASSSLNAASSSPSSRRLTIIVISPLKRLEQQENSNKFGIAAAELLSLNAVRNGELQAVLAAAERVLNEKFTSMLKEDCHFKI